MGAVSSVLGRRRPPQSARVATCAATSRAAAAVAADGLAAGRLFAELQAARHPDPRPAADRGDADAALERQPKVAWERRGRTTVGIKLLTYSRVLPTLQHGAVAGASSASL